VQECHQNKLRKEESTGNRKLPERILLIKLKSNSFQLVDRILVNQAVKQLPDGYRKLMTLHEVQRFDHEEIAELLSCASDTSKSQLYKAGKNFAGCWGLITIVSIQKLHEVIQKVF